ncbi:MucBP domain-containing protein [Tissierella praeacuta]|uniref:MucBP domain-containing protein n=1 Tax=Tissierella praeacuta TaxID=43131 RepID=UPI003DA1FD17
MLNIFDNVINDDFDYIMSSLGKELFIDNKLVKAWVKNTKVNNGYHERVLITEHQFSRGSIIDYEGLRYLILSDTMERKYGKYFKGNMRLTNELIYFKIDNKPYFFPSAIETEGMSLKTFNGGVLTLADGTMVVNLQENELTNKIKIKDKFYAMKTGWEVVGIDRSYKGLVKLYSNKATISEDITNPPADTEEYPSRPLDPSIPRGSITIKYIDEEGNILDTEVMSDLELKEYTINAKEIEGYTLSDTSSKTLTLTENNPNQKVIFYYEKVEEPIINYTITVVGAVEVEINKTSQYQAIVKADGEVVTDKEVVWEVTKKDGSSSIATIDQNGLLTAGNEQEDVYVIAKLQENPNISNQLLVDIFDPDDWGWG